MQRPESGAPCPPLGNSVTEDAKDETVLVVWCMGIRHHSQKAHCHTNNPFALRVCVEYTQCVCCWVLGDAGDAGDAGGTGDIGDTGDTVLAILAILGVMLSMQNWTH